MLLTARTCLEKGYSFSLGCPRCIGLRVIYGPFAERVVAKGLGDRPLAELFELGAFVCSEHRTAATFMAVTHDRDCTRDEIARWQKKGPATDGGAS